MDIRPQSSLLFARLRASDPRHYQIGALSLLLIYGVTGLGFGIGAAHIATVIGAALATQLVATRLARLPHFDPLSALISGIGLATLLRTSSLWIAALVAVIAIASKFLFRIDGRHVMNPTNGALVLMLALGAPVWISPGQYGHVTFVALAIACIGSVVVNRAARSDVSFAFLGAWAGILFTRALVIGEPLSIPVHRLENGLLLQFAFFMISDPRTTPRARAGRIGFAVMVALGGAFVQFGLFRTHGLLWSLALCSLAVPLINRLVPGEHYEWNAVRHAPGHSPGEPHEHERETHPSAAGDGARNGRLPWPRCPRRDPPIASADSMSPRAMRSCSTTARRSSWSAMATARC